MRDPRSAEGLHVAQQLFAKKRVRESEPSKKCQRMGVLWFEKKRLESKISMSEVSGAKLLPDRTNCIEKCVPRSENWKEISSDRSESGEGIEDVE